MPSVAFVDIRGEEGVIYVLERESGGLLQKIPLSVGSGYEFHTGDLPGDIDESFLSLPIKMLDFRILDLPVPDAEKAREVLPFELEGLIMGPAGGVSIDAFVFNGPGAGIETGTNKVLAAYAEKSILRNLINSMKRLGLDPRAVVSLDLSHVLKRAGASTGEEISRLLMEGQELEDEKRAAGAAEEIRGPSINLRRGDLAYTKEADLRRRSLGITAALLAALLVVTGLHTGYRIMQAKKEARSEEARLIKAYTDVFPKDKPSGAEGLSYKLKARLKEMRDKDAALTGIQVLGFLMDLQKTRTPDLAYNRILLDRRAVTLRGEAASPSSVQEAEGRLGSFLSEVKITETSQAASGLTSFTITARENPK